MTTAKTPRWLRSRQSAKEIRPTLSVIVAAYNMRREIPRTLHSLTPAYQHGIDDLDYEVIVVENGSTEPMNASDVTRFGPQFRHHVENTQSTSPVAAVNAAVRRCRGTHVMIVIDGARILSPGILRHAVLAWRMSPSAVVGTLSLHLGPELQNVSQTKGYDQQVEDELLSTVAWERDGYELFSIACLAASSADGWFKPIAESNCLAMSRALWDELGGFDERFQSAGGGLANLDLYKRAVSHPTALPVTLLGEGTFHQFHGGVASNARPDEHPYQQFNAEYKRIRGEKYLRPTVNPVYLGSVPDQARRLLVPDRSG